jgi:hypothetical protein
MPKKIPLALTILVLAAFGLSACVSIGDSTQPSSKNLTQLPISQEKRDPLAALTGTPAVSDVSGSVNITLQNNSDWNVCYAYLTPPTQDTWGKDRLTGLPEIVPGASQVIPFQAGAFDLRAENCDYMPLDEKYGVVFSGDSNWEINGPQELFFDDFNGGTVTWKTPAAGSGLAVLKDDSLQLTTSQKNVPDLAQFSQSVTDSTLVAETNLLQKPAGGASAFGAMCRIQANGDGYLFLARNDSQFSIQKYKDQKWVPLADWQPSKDVTLDEGTNIIEAECKAGELWLRINGTTVANVKDSDFSSGDFGLVALSFAPEPAAYKFDNLSVVVPDAFK